MRGNVGLDYDLSRDTTIGFYYQSKQGLTFDDAIRLQLPLGNFGIVRDVDVDLPTNIGIGVANKSLMGGRLLVAVDVLFKQWEEADFFDTIYENQWTVQLGAQYDWSDRVQLRAGYAWAEDMMRSNPSGDAGGVPVAVAALNYIEALFPAINEHRISGGVTIKNFLPNLDFDIFAGGMFDESSQFGATGVSLKSYWIGTGMTWRFGGDSCGSESACDDGCG